MIKEIKTAFLLLLMMSLLTGLFYPLLITGLATLCFPWQAKGSLVSYQGKIVGSARIGQYFHTPNFFWGRPSVTPLYPYNPMASMGSNLSAENPLLKAELVNRLNAFSSGNDLLPVPVDLVTASGSGLDPEISLASALYQVPRVALHRKLPESVLIDLIKREQQTFAWGLPRVNVLALNLALQQLEASYVQSPH